MKHARIAIVGLALLAAACTSGKTTGEASPGSTGENPVSTSSSAAENTALASVKPCELISSSEATSLSITSPTPEKSLGAEVCDWTGAGSSGLTVAVEPKQGVNDFNYEGATKTPSKFGKYDGFTLPAPKKSPGVCHALIAVSESSSVQIIASAGATASDTEKACEMAKKSADFVAAKLP
jgi:hypothetical protein